ncbi:hypothetical protein L4X63_20125 [Geomonas sp. Red32]|uniref:hypothetical protein n=1 Tax=Geomonas sp. Red32 TaxID=2912856 RepID=UPI00202D00CF|nr:hypothetical protein [Geomonas sp. Red32]MCM0083893.1 hypothetical protein [Geomonas sp. Red32]
MDPRSAAASGGSVGSANRLVPFSGESGRASRRPGRGDADSPAGALTAGGTPAGADAAGREVGSTQRKSNRAEEPATRSKAEVVSRMTTTQR